MDCFLCNAVASPGELFAENQFFAARFDAHPVTPGHVLIFPKDHTLSFFDIPAEAYPYLHDSITKAKQTIEAVGFEELYLRMKEAYPEREKATQYIESMLASPFLKRKPEGYTIGVNNGEVAGQTVPHVHMHLIPRYRGDVIDPRGGVRTVIPALGNYRIYGN